MSKDSCVLISTPSFTDDEVFVDSEDAIAIFSFFWPEYRSQIANLSMTIQKRKFAQQILIAGVNATYAMGFIEMLMKSFMSPKRGLQSVLRKLAKKSVRHWFTCATGDNLKNPQIAFAVKVTITQNFDTAFNEMLLGLMTSTEPKRFFVHLNTMSRRMG